MNQMTRGILRWLFSIRGQSLKEPEGTWMSCATALCTILQLYVRLSNAVNFLIIKLFWMIYHLIWANLTNLILVVSKMQSPVTLVFQVQDGASMVQRRARTSSIKLKGISLYFKAFFKYQMALYFCCGCGKTHTEKIVFLNSMNRKVFDIVMCVVNNNFQYCKKVFIFQVFDICQYFF